MVTDALSSQASRASTVINSGTSVHNTVPFWGKDENTGGIVSISSNLPVVALLFPHSSSKKKEIFITQSQASEGIEG